MSDIANDAAFIDSFYAKATFPDPKIEAFPVLKFEGFFGTVPDISSLRWQRNKTAVKQIRDRGDGTYMITAQTVNSS